MVTYIDRKKEIVVVLEIRDSIKIIFTMDELLGRIYTIKIDRKQYTTKIGKFIVTKPLPSETALNHPSQIHDKTVKVIGMKLWVRFDIVG